MDKKSFYYFVSQNILNASRRGSNCSGFALYAVGEINSESVLNRDHSRKYLSKMSLSSVPKKGYVVDWRLDNIPFHTGVIIEENPLVIAHRKGKNDLVTKVFFEEIDSLLKGEVGCRALYRIPNKLTKD
jgi:hypothetical protein